MQTSLFISKHGYIFHMKVSLHARNYSKRRAILLINSVIHFPEGKHKITHLSFRSNSIL